MRRCCVLFLAAGLSLAAAPEAPREEGAPEWAKALHKAAGLDRYAFRTEEKGAGGAGQGVEGKYQKGRPVAFEADNIVFLKKGDALVYKQAGQWQRSKTGTTSDPLRVLGAVARVRTTRLPHEELAVLDKHLKDVKKVDGKDGEAVYSGTLDEEAAKQLARSEHRSVARGGTAKLWVTDGAVTKYEVAIELRGRLGNAEIDGSTTRTVSLREVGTARVEVPEAAAKALE